MWWQPVSVAPMWCCSLPEEHVDRDNLTDISTCVYLFVSLFIVTETQKTLCFCDDKS